MRKAAVMSLVRFDVTDPYTMSSVLTTESVEELGLAAGDTVDLVLETIRVLPVKP